MGIRTMKHLMNYFNEVNTLFLLFIIFSLNFLSFVPNGNEEHYLLFAKVFFEPNWLPSEQGFHEFPGTRLLYQSIVGFFLKFLSFEAVTFIFRFILICSFSFVLNKLYKRFSFSNAQILMHLIVLFLGHQSFFGGSSMFLSVESKTFAYVFVLFALYFLTINNIRNVTLCLIAATYLHFLVGFYSFFYFFLTVFFVNWKTIKGNFKYSLVYILAMVPFVYYLKSSISMDISDLVPDPNWIYTYFRHPHHTALFKSNIYFYRSHFYGVVFSIIGFYFLIRNFSSSEIGQKSLYTLGLISFFCTLILVPVAFFDKTGFLLKFYLYRINTLSVFILTFLFTKVVFSHLKERYLLKWNEIILLVSLVPTFKVVAENFYLAKTYVSNPIEELFEFAKCNTNKESVFLNLTNDVSASRRMERNTFVEYKFAPAELGKINLWYDKHLAQLSIEKDIANLKKVSEKYNLNYIATDRPFFKVEGLKLIFSNGSYFLYQIDFNN